MEKSMLVDKLIPLIVARKANVSRGPFPLCFDTRSSRSCLSIDHFETPIVYPSNNNSLPSEMFRRQLVHRWRAASREDSLFRHVLSHRREARAKDRITLGGEERNKHRRSRVRLERATRSILSSPPSDACLRCCANDGAILRADEAFP